MSEHKRQGIYAAFDMGGTFIKASLMNDSGKIVKGTFGIFPACSDQAAERILNRITEILLHMLASCPDGALKGIGFSFPGPFDYENGISYIRGLNKYDALYGINIREEIAGRVDERAKEFRKACSFKILFENDASLFALGECCKNKELQNTPVLCLTLGTGVGSAFLREGRLLKEDKDIPRNGWIYCCAYKDRQVEDYLSRRGVIELARERHISVREPAALYGMAVQGNETARKIWGEFGKQAGEILSPFMERFGGKDLVLGGQIAKAAVFFLDELEKIAGNRYRVHIAVGKEDESVFQGIYQLLVRGIIYESRRK
ncbi:MAG: ROK family protein [Lachnospiraceae bacterium]|jgi:glucokinase|nr:ROK family protein [Lachnospiraceae bacterium]